MDSMIGHNGGPTPFEELEALRIEAKHWLDGSHVHTQAEADAIGHITSAARAIAKRLDALRVEEKRPHDDAAKAVQERYKPYLTQCDTIADACKKAVTPYLQKLDSEKRERERIAREDADRKRAEAEAAIRAAKQSSLEEREAAEAKLAEAKRAEAIATRAENDRARAATGGRSMSLRTSWRPELTDRMLAARHFWQTQPDAFDDLLMRLAREAVTGGARAIPGFVVHEIREAV